MCAVLAAAASCKKEEEARSERDNQADDAGTSKVAAVEPNLAQAMAAASASANPGAPGADNQGPPPNGIFAPGMADKEMTKDGEPKITLGSEGTEPKVRLGPSLEPGTKVSGAIQVALQTDAQMGAIPVLLSLTIEAKKPAGAAANTPDAETKPEPVPVSVRVTGAKIDAPGAPRDLDAQFAKLKGSRVDYLVLPNGAGTGYRFETPPGIDNGELRDTIRSLSDTLALITIPFPDKPIGQGGFWMVTSRGDLFGLDLVTYRLIKVEKVGPSSVTLKVNTKRYAADSRFELPGLPPNIPPNIVEFQANSDGTLELPQGSAIPKSGRIDSALLAVLGDASSKQRAAVQLQSRAQISLQ